MPVNKKNFNLKIKELFTEVQVEFGRPQKITEYPWTVYTEEKTLLPPLAQGQEERAEWKAGWLPDQAVASVREHTLPMVTQQERSKGNAYLPTTTPFL